MSFHAILNTTYFITFWTVAGAPVVFRTIRQREIALIVMMAQELAISNTKLVTRLQLVATTTAYKTA